MDLKEQHLHGYSAGELARMDHHREALINGTKTLRWIVQTEEYSRLAHLFELLWLTEKLEAAVAQVTAAFLCWRYTLDADGVGNFLVVESIPFADLSGALGTATTFANFWGKEAQPVLLVLNVLQWEKERLIHYITDQRCNQPLMVMPTPHSPKPKRPAKPHIAQTKQKSVKADAQQRTSLKKRKPMEAAVTGVL
jgi:hypothetical protein